MIPAVKLNDELSLSRVIYGVWRLADDPDTSATQVRAKIDACLEQGMSSFDHADIYGDYRCEQLFGAALQQSPGLRAQMQLISKCDIMLLSEQYPQRTVKYYDTSPAHIRLSVENSLRHLHTDYLDMLLLHRPDPLMDAEATGRVLDELVEQGKVRAVGVSNFRSWDWDLLQSAMQQPLLANQIELSLLQREGFTDGTLAHLQQHKGKPMAWSPLAGGALFGNGEAMQRLRPLMEALAQQQDCALEHIALAWLMAHPAMIMPVVGTNNLQRIRDIHHAMRPVIDRETWFALWTAAAGQEVP